MKLIIFGMLFLFCLSSNLVFAETFRGRVEAETNAKSLFAEEGRIYELVNDERERRGLYSLNWNSRLADLARSYSIKMARENFFSHFDRNGDSITERARAMRINGWERLGENLFMCQGCESFSQFAVRGWMKSSGHRKNILQRDFNETGIGIARSRNGTIFVTQVFMER